MFCTCENLPLTSPCPFLESPFPGVLYLGTSTFSLFTERSPSLEELKKHLWILEDEG